MAYTDFGARPRQVDGRWNSGEPWVFTSYLAGSFDNLAELLHETGHAIHIAAIRTRPAFMDWPDNDTFTEALADFPAMELYEPAWQIRFLGDSATLAESLRAKYAGIVFDVAWGLFELRMDRDPTLDPNQVWTDITSRYFGIRPHPEWSWWAMRGQLIDGPGYLVNYAIGAIITADLRARMQALRGSFVTSDTGPGIPGLRSRSTATASNDRRSVCWRSSWAGHSGRMRCWPTWKGEMRKEMGK